MSKIRIAIDGPAGSGKSTVARKVAEALNYIYVDSGAMYRAVTVAVLRHGISMDNHEAIIRIAERIHLEFRPVDSGQGYWLYMDNEDVHDEIRSLKVTDNVSFVAAIPEVRHSLVQLQKALTGEGGVVMEGRDIGTVVMPDAELKVFLTASVEERTNRRWLELKAKGVQVDPIELREAILRRDAIDSGREADPLRPAEDSVPLDTTGLDIEQVIAAILELARGRGADAL